MKFMTFFLAMMSSDKHPHDNPLAPSSLILVLATCTMYIITNPIICICQSRNTQLNSFLDDDVPL